MNIKIHLTYGHTFGASADQAGLRRGLHRETGAYHSEEARSASRETVSQGLQTPRRCRGPF